MHVATDRPVEARDAAAEAAKSCRARGPTSLKAKQLLQAICDRGSEEACALVKSLPR
jgi:hypothetical protein